MLLKPTKLSMDQIDMFKNYLMGLCAKNKKKCKYECTMNVIA